MFVLAMEASLPTTLWGWVAVFGGVLTAIALVGGIIIVTAKTHINRRVDVKLEDKTKDTVEECLKPIEVKIDGLVEGQRKATDVSADAIGRISNLETTINNGLTHATAETRTKVGEMEVLLAEMHGWMKATHSPGAEHAPWDGVIERRS